MNNKSNKAIDRKDISSQRPLVCYALRPGTMISKHDKQVHYINAEQLARLYGVDYRKCVVIDATREETYLGRDLSKYVMLWPRYDGDYSLPSA